MKTLLVFLLFTGSVYAQTHKVVTRRDSIPDVFPPDQMPNTQSATSFYRYRSDPSNVMRATLDNMPVKVPDSSTYYSMLRASRRPYSFLLKPQARPMPLIPQPHIPRRW